MTRIYRLSNDAVADLENIYTYSIKKFGSHKATNYLHGLHDLFELLADNPRLGRDCSNVKTGYRKHEHRKHTIYYTILDCGILIARILGERQNQDRQLL